MRYSFKSANRKYSITSTQFLIFLKNFIIYQLFFLFIIFIRIGYSKGAFIFFIFYFLKKKKKKLLKLFNFSIYKELCSVNFLCLSQYIFTSGVFRFFIIQEFSLIFNIYQESHVLVASNFYFIIYLFD